MPEHKPGPELDALMAEKVMGWKPVLGTDDVILGYATNEGDYRSAMPGNSRVWRPSIDIAATWEVMAELDAWDWQLTSHSEGFTMTIFKDATHYEATADTAPLAICLAALEAVEAGGDDV